MKSGRGKLRKAWAMGMSRATEGLSPGLETAVPDASKAEIAWSSCSEGERLGTATPHLRAQSLKRPKLKLFDGALAFLEPGGDFADRALLNEALANDAALNGGKPVNQATEVGVVFAGLEVA